MSGPRGRDDQGKLVRGVGGRPRVERGQDVHRVIADLEEALGEMTAGDPRLFQRGGDLVITRGVTAEDAKRLRIAFSPDAVVIAPLRSATLLSRITEFVDYGYWGWEEKEGDSAVVRSRVWKTDLPSGTVLGALLNKPYWAHIRQIRGISVTPIMHLDGSLVHEGYDARSKYLVASNIELPPIPDAPTRDDAVAALAELAEPFSEFPHETEDERYAPVGLVLTIVLRPAIPGNVPGYACGAAQKNCGKSLETKAACRTATGRIPASNTWPKLEEEQEKMIGASADAGADVLFFDNAAEGAVIGGAPIDKVLTCDGSNSFRVLGRSELKHLPWGATVVFTGNRAKIGGDSDRRLVQWQLVRRDEPITYKHEDLLAYVLAERPRLLAAAFTLARAWIRAGSPRAGIRRLDSFERWAWTVPSMIRWAGGADVRELVRDIAGTEADELEATLLEQLYQYLQTRRRPDVSVHELVADVFRVGHGDELAALRGAMEEIAGYEGTGIDRKIDVRRLGCRLGLMKNLLQGGYRLRPNGKTAGRLRWTVERRAASGVSGVSGVDPISTRAHADAENAEAGNDPTDQPDPPRGRGTFGEYLGDVDIRGGARESARLRLAPGRAPQPPCLPVRAPPPGGRGITPSSTGDSPPVKPEALFLDVDARTTPSKEPAL